MLCNLTVFPFSKTVNQFVLPNGGIIMDAAINSLRVESLSPEKAAEYFRYNYAHNRRLRQHHVEYLLNEMKSGRFMPTAEIHLMYRNGEPVLVNGQHTCAAIAKFGKPVTVTVRKTIVKEPGQIAMAYAFGHDTGLRRTFNDAMGAYNIAEQTGLTDKQVETVSSALRHIMNDFVLKPNSGGGTIKKSPADLVDYIYAWSANAKILFSVTAEVNKSLSNLTRKRGVVSIGLLTIHYQRDKAIDFWQGIVRPDGLLYADARMTARRYIEMSKGQPGTNGITAARLSRQLASCWNAFYRGELLSKAQVADETSKVKLLGTPYNGKQPDGFLSILNEIERNFDFQEINT